MIPAIGEYFIKVGQTSKKVGQMRETLSPLGIMTHTAGLQKVYKGNIENL